MKLYHELAEFYFTIEDKHRDISQDAALVRRLLKDKKGTELTLLDLGCGSGEHMNLLSRMNIRCTGIDSSNDMLRIARKRFPDSGRYINADMTAFDCFEEFDAVISLFGSFNYLISDADVDMVCRNSWRALKPGGIGLFEIWNAPPIRAIANKEKNLVSISHYRGTRIGRERGFSLMPDPERTLVDVFYTYTLSRNGVIEEVFDRHIMRAFTRDEIEGFITRNGLVMVNCYSNAMQDPYRETSNRILAHFAKP